MIKKTGIFKKILTPDSGSAAESPPPSDKENPATAVDKPLQEVQRQPAIPPPRPKEKRSESHDPFEDAVDFGFTADDAPPASPTTADAPERVGEPTNTTPTPSPTFAIPEEKQMSQPAIATPPAYPNSIPQLELRAIFGVDHSMDAEEILDRCRNLSGIRKISQLAEGDAGTIDAIRSMIARLGFGDEPVEIRAGTTPIDFIREGRIALAVQTENGFAPGVRETLILVARELAKM